MVVLGIVLLLVGACLLVAEAHVPAGFLGAAGGVSLAGGAALAIAGAGGGLAIILPATLAICAGAGLWLALVARKALGVQGRRALSGRESLSGRPGVVRNWSGPDGQVFVDGALWRARRSWADDEEALEKGDTVVVERVSGLTLGVRRAEGWEEPW